MWVVDQSAQASLHEVEPNEACVTLGVGLRQPYLQQTMPMMVKREPPKLRIHAQFLKIKITLDLPPNRVIKQAALTEAQHGGAFGINHCTPNAVVFQ